jgi:hypothetical protein
VAAAASFPPYMSVTVEITEGYEFSQSEMLRAMELYDAGRFTTGNTGTYGFASLRRANCARRDLALDRG